MSQDHDGTRMKVVLERAAKPTVDGAVLGTENGVHMKRLLGVRKKPATLAAVVAVTGALGATGPAAHAASPVFYCYDPGTSDPFTASPKTVHEYRQLGISCAPDTRR